MKIKSLLSALAPLVELIFYTEKFSPDKDSKKSLPNVTSSSLSQLLNNYGSDKSSKHGYDYWYAEFLDAISTSECLIIEFGIGTNDLSLPSNMGSNGRAGASLRAFRDYTIKPLLIGIDIDPNSLFSENRISTFLSDQRYTIQLRTVMRQIAEQARPIKMVIVDGLHEPHADARTLMVALPHLANKGRIYIEDISPNKYIQLYWKVICFILNKKGFDHEKFVGKSGSILLMFEKNIT
jgi:hypothetical protein